MILLYKIEQTINRPIQINKMAYQRSGLDPTKHYMKVERGVPDTYMGQFVREYRMNGSTTHWDFKNTNGIVAIAARDTILGFVSTDPIPPTCYFCKGSVGPYGNNPAPFGGANDVCCDVCNMEKVVPARLAQMK